MSWETVVASENLLSPRSGVRGYQNPVLTLARSCPRAEEEGTLENRFVIGVYCSMLESIFFPSSSSDSLDDNIVRNA
jgi:hypothetical protein